MGSIWAWTLGVGLGVAALVAAAALKLQDGQMAYVHMAIAAVVALGIASISIRETRAAAAGGAGPEAVAGTGLRFLGLVWTWGALTLFATYAVVLQWREWWHFVIACAVLAALCLMLAGALGKDAARGNTDAAMLKLARILTRVHLGAMIITLIGLLVDGKMVRFLNPRHHDWAAQNVFFFGALAMAAISWSALVSLKSATRPAAP